MLIGAPIGLLGSARGAWLIGGAIYEGRNGSVAGQTTSPYGLDISADGTKAYVANAEQSTGKIFQYALSTPWDVSSLGYASKYLSTNSQGNYVGSVRLSADGSKLYATMTIASIFQYALSTPWDVSTGVLSTSKSFSSEMMYPSYPDFKTDGTKVYVCGTGATIIFQYTLASAWVINTASYDSKSFDCSAQVTTVAGFRLSLTGNYFYVLCGTSKKIFQYRLSSAWDVSTAVYTGKYKDVSAQDTSPTGLAFKTTDGSQVYVTGNVNDKIYQYSLF